MLATGYSKARNTGTTPCDIIVGGLAGWAVGFVRGAWKLGAVPECPGAQKLESGQGGQGGKGAEYLVPVGHREATPMAKHFSARFAFSLSSLEQTKRRRWNICHDGDCRRDGMHQPNGRARGIRGWRCGSPSTSSRSSALVYRRLVLEARVMTDGTVGNGLADWMLATMDKLRIRNLTSDGLFIKEVALGALSVARQASPWRSRSPPVPKVTARLIVKPPHLHPQPQWGYLPRMESKKYGFTAVTLFGRAAAARRSVLLLSWGCSVKGLRRARRGWASKLLLPQRQTTYQTIEQDRDSRCLQTARC